MSHNLTKEKFLECVKNHKMKIISEDGINRHIQFMNDKSSNMYFNLTTFPGYLCFSGDMGCYVFSRLEDMFQFFRSDRINEGYWHEKLEAVDRCSGSKEYSPELFNSTIKEWFDEWEIDEPDKEKTLDVWKEIKRQVLSNDEFECEAMHSAMDFNYRGFSFSDFWEVDLKEYTYRFIWCLYAIVWGIEQYDKFKAENPQNKENDK